MLAVGVLVGLALAAVRGADWARLAEVRWRLWPLIVVGFLVQLVLYGAFEGRTLPELPYAAALYVLSNLLVLASLVANSRVPGVRLVVLGAALNLAAIVANGGQMPSVHRGMTDATPLWFLADWIEVPFLPRRQFSIGDLFLAVGSGIAVYALARRRDAGAGAASDGRDSSLRSE
jgi:hypothetical protein